MGCVLQVSNCVSRIWTQRQNKHLSLHIIHFCCIYSLWSKHRVWDNFLFHTVFMKWFVCFKYPRAFRGMPWRSSLVSPIEPYAHIFRAVNIINVTRCYDVAKNATTAAIRFLNRTVCAYISRSRNFCNITFVKTVRHSKQVARSIIDQSDHMERIWTQKYNKKKISPA